MDFDEYLERMADPRCSGSHTEIQAMSEMYNRRIDVYSFDLGVCARLLQAPRVHCASLCFCHVRATVLCMPSVAVPVDAVPLTAAPHPFPPKEPINTFQGHLTQNAPIRLAFYYSHYDAILDPARPTFGVGIGATTAEVRRACLVLPLSPITAWLTVAIFPPQQSEQDLVERAKAESLEEVRSSRLLVVLWPAGQH